MEEKDNSIKEKKANQLTGIASVFAIIIPAITLLTYILSSYNNTIWTAGFKFIIPISIIIGITLLTYIRIKYPDNYWSKQLIKICIAIYIMAFIIIGPIIECNRCLNNCSKMPG